MSFQDHFSRDAAAYARSRPRYPPELFDRLARLVSPRDLAWDCGTGNGQAALGLTKHFERVHATDASASQLREAVPHPRVSYQCARECESSLADQAVDLVTVAQAAHWLDLEPFYREVRRVLRPGGVLAVWCYGLCQIDPATDALLEEFCYRTVGPSWPPERHFVDAGYRTLPFPFPEEPFPVVTMQATWTRLDLVAYVSTWSAVAEFRKQRGADPIPALVEQLRDPWEDPNAPRKVTWPLTGRIGRMPAPVDGHGYIVVTNQP